MRFTRSNIGDYWDGWTFIRQSSSLCSTRTQTRTKIEDFKQNIGLKPQKIKTWFLFRFILKTCFCPSLLLSWICIYILFSTIQLKNLEINFPSLLFYKLCQQNFPPSLCLQLKKFPSLLKINRKLHYIEEPTRVSEMGKRLKNQIRTKPNLSFFFEFSPKAEE